MENDNDKKFTYYLCMYGQEFGYRSYIAPVEELMEAEENDNLYDCLDENYNDISCNCGPYIGDLEGESLSIEDSEGNPLFTISLSVLSSKEREEDVFPECDDEEAVAYILEWGKGCTARVGVKSDIDLSKLSLEEIQNNITIGYANIHYWDEDGDVETEKIITDIYFFGERYYPQEESSTRGQATYCYWVDADDEDEEE